MAKTLRIATYNIHKGFSHFNRRLMVHELRESLHGMGADLLFLQEVLGSHQEHALTHENWPTAPQYEFLAESMWPEFAYGKNAVYEEGHHGNAILSRFPILKWDNYDISGHRFESRGLLHCEIEIPGWESPLHCICIHMGLSSRVRRKQVAALQKKIEELVPQQAPLIVAGDFNDWSCRAEKITVDGRMLNEVFETTQGKVAKTFPSSVPLFRLDRIYVRGFNIREAAVHQGRPWSKISDHAPLSTTLVLK
jgi:endonuclease/exonuclease/phosphatase family metal-dependent hydrolase